MNILVNAVSLLSPLTGIGQYTRHLFSTLLQNESARDCDFRFFYGFRCVSALENHSQQEKKILQGTYGVMRALLPRPRGIKRFIERNCFRYFANKAPHRTLYHEPNILPHPYRGPCVISLHDLSCFDFPETHPAERVRIMQSELPRAVKSANRIITISEFTKREIVRRFSVAPEKIAVTLLAADHRFKPRTHTELEPALTPMQLHPGRYILSVGTLEPRKNLTTLFAAYEGLPASLRKRFPLVIAGMSGWHTQTLRRSAKTLLDRGELRFLGYVPDKELPNLYAGAAAFAYPSRYEGFGLPPLEAMASGTPVLASSCTSIPEVIGDAGILLGPDDTDGYRESLQHVLEDPEYAKNLVGCGLERARKFSWERCAGETLAVYREVLGR